jgi:hypothetical protein
MDSPPKVKAEGFAEILRTGNPPSPSFEDSA